MAPPRVARRRDNTPEPPPKPDENSGGRDDVVACEQTARASPREKEGEEECDEEFELEDEPGVTTDTKAKVHGRGKAAFSADRRQYKALVSDEARKLGEKIIEHMEGNRSVKGGKGKSSEQYSRHVWRYLYFCEQKVEMESTSTSSVIYFISLSMFAEFLEWYDKFSGHLQTNYKICGVALGHVLRYFLRLGDEAGESVVDESEKRFRSTVGLTREQAKEIAANENKNDANVGFWGEALSERTTIVKKAKSEARNNGVVATTQGTSVDKIKEEEMIYRAGLTAHDLLLAVQNECELSNASLRCARFLLELGFLGRPGEMPFLRVSGMTIRKPNFGWNPNPNRPVTEFLMVSPDHKTANIAMHQSAGQDIDRVLERL